MERNLIANTTQRKASGRVQCDKWNGVDGTISCLALHLHRFLNKMHAQQASKSEYDAMAALGNPGWSFDDLVPYFKKAQSHTPQRNDVLDGKDTLTENQGADGPIRVGSCTISSLISY